MTVFDEWEWLSHVPRSVERERFNVSAAVVRKREGTHLGEIREVKVS